MTEKEQNASEANNEARGESIEGQILPKNPIGGQGKIRNRGMSEESDKQRNTTRPTEDAALSNLDDWSPKKK